MNIAQCYNPSILELDSRDPHSTINRHGVERRWRRLVGETYQRHTRETGETATYMPEPHTADSGDYCTIF